MTRIEALAIDLDDTLCLTEEASFAMENEALQQLARPPMPREIHRGTWGKPLFEIIASRSPGVDVTAFRNAFAPVIANYVSSGRLDAISPANFLALDTLVAEDRRLFILTSRTHAELKHLLEPDHELGGANHGVLLSRQYGVSQAGSACVRQITRRLRAQACIMRLRGGLAERRCRGKWRWPALYRQPGKRLAYA